MARPVPLAAQEGTLSLPHGSAHLSFSDSPCSSSLSPAQKERGQEPGALLSGWPSRHDLPAVVHPWNTPQSRRQLPGAAPLPHPHRTRAPAPALMGELSYTPNATASLWPSSAKPHCSHMLCAVLQGRTSLPLIPGSCLGSGSLPALRCPSFTRALPRSARWEGEPSLPPWPPSPPHTYPTALYSAPHHLHTRASPFAYALTHSCAEAAVVIFSWWKSQQNIL